MRELRFGDRVFVDAETVRVLRGLNNEVVMFRHVDSQRYNKRAFANEESWPGQALPFEWETPAVAMELEPQNGETTIRLRRFEETVAPVGLVLGRATKHEGVIRSGAGDSYLSGPGRKVDLTELALPPKGKGKARIVLAYYRDLRLIS